MDPSWTKSMNTQLSMSGHSNATCNHTITTTTVTTTTTTTPQPLLHNSQWPLTYKWPVICQGKQFIARHSLTVTHRPWEATTMPPLHSLSPEIKANTTNKKAADHCICWQRRQSKRQLTTHDKTSVSLHIYANCDVTHTMPWGPLWGTPPKKTKHQRVQWLAVI